MRIKQRSKNVREMASLQRQQKLIEAVVSLDELRNLLDAGKRSRVQPVFIAAQCVRRVFVTAGIPKLDCNALATKLGGDGWIQLSAEAQLPSREASLSIGGMLRKTKISARFDGSSFSSWTAKRDATKKCDRVPTDQMETLS